MPATPRRGVAPHPAASTREAEQCGCAEPLGAVRLALVPSCRTAYDQSHHSTCPRLELLAADEDEPTDALATYVTVGACVKRLTGHLQKACPLVRS